MSQSKLIGEKILKRTPYGCRVEGVDVVLTLGKVCATMDYTTAIKLSAFLRNAGRLAKRNAGDESRRWTIFADLTDGNAEELRARMNKSRTIITGSVGD